MTARPSNLPRVPPLGLGIGWRPELALAIARRAAAGKLGFVEILAEDFDPDADPPGALAALMNGDVAVIPHGVTLSLGGAEPVDRAKVRRLANLARRFGS